MGSSGTLRWSQQSEGSSLGLGSFLQQEGVGGSGKEADQGVVTEAEVTALAGWLDLRVTRIKDGRVALAMPWTKIGNVREMGLAVGG